jgi:hypothetical protein
MDVYGKEDNNCLEQASDGVRQPDSVLIKVRKPNFKALSKY